MGGWTLESAEQANVLYRHHTHHEAPDITIRSSNALGMLIVLFPFPVTAYQGHRESEESIFDPRSVIRLNNPLDLLNA